MDSKVDSPVVSLAGDHKALRYTETALELDEKVYVFGETSQLDDGWMLRHDTMPLIVSDKGPAAVEISFSTKVIIFGVLTMLSAAAGCTGLYLLMS